MGIFHCYVSLPAGMIYVGTGLVQPPTRQVSWKRRENHGPPSWDPKNCPVASLEGGGWQAKIIQKSPSRNETKIRTPPPQKKWWFDVGCRCVFPFPLGLFPASMCFFLGGRCNPGGYSYMMS